MHNVLRRSVAVLVLAVLSGLLPVTAPAAKAQSATCANREVPPPPVDTSEKPATGQAAPAPLPVPGTPIGGARMAECGVVLPPNTLNPPDTTAASWVLQDLDTGAILAAKDPHARARPASLIKTLLALVVTRELKPDQVITATAEDASQECTCVGLVAGGKYTVDQLMHGLLMHSGNDAAHAFATVLGGVPAALEKMNSLAASLGATDTRAATPSGLDGPGMSTSAYDMSLIFNQAMKQPEFANVIATKVFQFPAAGDKPSFPIFNDNKLLGVYPGFLGGKTGFTGDARHTYAGAAKQGNKRLAVVMLRGEQRPTRLADQAGQLLDYGFALATHNPEPVGQIADLTVSQSNGGNTGPAVNTEQANASPVKAPEDPFGVTGWVITLVVTVLVVIGGIFEYRRKKASATASSQPGQ